jgi:Uma2 family endonuclease
MTVQTKPYTLEEYLILEEQAEYKNEYFNGEIIPMTGGTTAHNQIAGNLYAALKYALKGKPYKIYIGDVKVWIPTYRIGIYPDVMVISGESVYHGKGTTIVTNPALIVEVLFKSTRTHDRTDKFDQYWSLETMQEYLLLERTERKAYQYAKTESGQWLFTEYRENETLTLTSLNLTFTLSELYEGIDFIQPEEWPAQTV